MAELGRSRGVAGGGTASRQTSTLLLPAIQASQVRGLEMRPPLPPQPRRATSRGKSRKGHGSATSHSCASSNALLSHLVPETSL